MSPGNLSVCLALLIGGLGAPGHCTIVQGTCACSVVSDSRRPFGL